MRKKNREFLPPSFEEIAAYAYFLWEAEGRQHGRDLDYWLEAESHLTADRQYEAGLLSRASFVPPVHRHSCSDMQRESVA